MVYIIKKLYKSIIIAREQGVFISVNGQIVQYAQKYRKNEKITKENLCTNSLGGIIAKPALFCYSIVVYKIAGRML